MNQFKCLPSDFTSNVFSSSSSTLCPLCDQSFELSFKLHLPRHKLDQLRKHLVVDHQFVISDIGEICDFDGYLNHWRQKFQTNSDLRSFCAVIRTNSRPDDLDESQDFFMLCPDVLPEDAFLRQDLKKAKINQLLVVLERERNQQDFSRSCLFCRKQLIGNRKQYFEHLREQHNFSFGNPDNLVFTDEFLDLIEEKLNRRVCLYCEHSFKDWNALKEHMRKKFHKHLNPYNKDYDKFYVNNYMRGEQNWKRTNSVKTNNPTESLKTWTKVEEDQDEDENWDDWTQNQEEPLKILCLFCDHTFISLDKFEQHLLLNHKLQFQVVLSYPFYKQVKLVNYARRCQLDTNCMNCDLKFQHESELATHYQDSRHLYWPEEKMFDYQQYYLPTLEEDHLLRTLVDCEQTVEEQPPVVPESDQMNDRSQKEMFTNSLL